MRVYLDAVRKAARGMILADQRARRVDARLSSIEQSLSVLTLASVDANEARARILSIAKLLQPYRAAGHTKTRVGRMGDGGYVMISDFTDIGGALSFGIGDEMSWDLDIATRGIHVHQFDHSIETPPAMHPNIVFHRKKVVGRPSDEGETLVSILANASADPRKEWVLKIDIEDDEWVVFDAAPIATLRRFRQIVCEFHHFRLIAKELQRYERCLSVLRKLMSLFGVVHIHANNYAPMVLIGGVPFPDILEVTLANREHYNLVDSSEVFPTPLDCANKRTAEDYFLGRFVFDCVPGGDA